MIHVSLFSGIDGFGLAADAAGIETVAVCEIGNAIAVPVVVWIMKRIVKYTND